MKFFGKQIIKDAVGFAYFNFYKKFKKKGNRALIYHAFGSKLDHDTYGISIDMKSFISHIDYLYDNYLFTKISDNHSEKLTISITIDDGYKDTLDAVSYLSKYDIPFSLYITTNMIGKHQYLNKNDIENISSIKNCELGTHGQTHSRLGNMTFNEQNNELQKSKKYLEDIIQKKVNCMSYPHGSYNKETIEILKKLDYLNASSSNKGFNSYSTSKFEQKRIEIIKDDSISMLARKINGFYDYF
tara:strand:+ start:519 stop:1247 length:729 start_codon:yes stop_codon:yes gene_type:complete